jgi:hypothetical protein
MFDKILNYFIDILKAVPLGRKVFALLVLLRIKVKQKFRTHPLLLFAVALCLLVSGFFHPEWVPEIIRPEHKCYVIETEHGELYKGNGDALKFGEERPCSHGQVVALEFMNLSLVHFSEDKAPLELVSAGIFLRESALGNPGSTQWHEYTLFHKANDFVWNVLHEQSSQDVFIKNGCGFDRENKKAWDSSEFRQGIELRSSALRSNPKLTRPSWLHCNYGTPEEPTQSDCSYINLDFFLQTIKPERWCSTYSIWDKWLAPGTRKYAFADSGAFETLRLLAQDRWDVKRAAKVADLQWRTLSNAMPKLCMRWMGPKDEWLGDMSRWDEFASIAAVWCDY